MELTLIQQAGIGPVIGCPTRLANSDNVLTTPKEKPSGPLTEDEKEKLKFYDREHALVAASDALNKEAERATEELNGLKSDYLRMRTQLGLSDPPTKQELAKLPKVDQDSVSKLQSEIRLKDQQIRKLKDAEKTAFDRWQEIEAERKAHCEKAKKSKKESPTDDEQEEGF